MASGVKALFLQLDHELGQYVTASERSSSSSSDDSNGGDDAAEVSALERRVETLLARLADACGDPAADSAVARNNASRLADMRADFHRARRRVADQRARAELLRGAKQFRRVEGETSIAVDELVRERGHIFEADRTAEGILGVALDTQGALGAQRQTASGTRGKLGAFGGILGAAGKTMSAIKWKKRRNSVILAAVIAACLCFLFWWWWTSR